jgi:formylglycine-generating enzyme required for sulfatase activity
VTDAHTIWPPVDSDAVAGESPAHRVRLPRYFLARYPVTVAQWRVYYEAVRGGDWEARPPDGWRFARLDERSVEGVATHPVVHVSWYDAMDYGRWLTAHIRTAGGGSGRTTLSRLPAPIVRLMREGDTASKGRPWMITLPSEAEWERAARGPATVWRYPWGNDWDANRANGLDSDEKETSAVGGYPGGTGPAKELGRQRRPPMSPGRIEEQSGNVWELTRSVWDAPYPYEPDYVGCAREDVRAGKGVVRVMRGGSFRHDPWLLRSAFRAQCDPWSRNDWVGFRVAASPFAPEL